MAIALQKALQDPQGRLNSPCLIKLFSVLRAEKPFKIVYVSALLSRVLAAWGVKANNVQGKILHILNNQNAVREKLNIMTILFHLKDFLWGKYTLPCQHRRPDKAQTNFALLPFGRGQSLCCSHSLSLQPRRLPGTTIQSWRKRAKPRLVMLVVQTHTVPLPSLHPSSFECINMLWKKMYRELQNKNV